MSRYSFFVAALIGSGLLSGAAATSACGGNKHSSGFGGNTSGSSSGGSNSSGSTGSSSSGSSNGGSTSGGFNFDGGTSGGSGGGTPTGDGGIACPPGLMCDVPCAAGATTSITGKVYDPTGKNPLYNVAVYVPATPLQPLPKGVPTGADACNCSALFKSGAITSAVTGVDGTFTLTNAPVGTSVPLVLQVGKWRRSLHINVNACQANAQPDRSLTLPGTVAPASDDNMPDIAVSTGVADTLECLMRRIGLPTSEYVTGAGGAGHVHVFAGGDPIGMPPPLWGTPEAPPMPGAPPSNTSLWASADQLMPYDITLLSCEGGETFSANPSALETYLNAGGRAFASHFHYAWFVGPILTMTTGAPQNYTPPADWGTNLATWSLDPVTPPAADPIGGIIVTTLNGSTMQFPKGVALQQWLQLVGALQGTPPAIPPGELTISAPRYNAMVNASNKPSQPWITSDNLGISGDTLYFSFDTPVNAQPAPDGGPPQYCGRAVFSDLHVGGASSDMPPPPNGCADADLSPQEKALEFMLFDLSSCVIPDTIQPPVVVPPPPQ
jgi:hypothetical protein